MVRWYIALAIFAVLVLFSGVLLSAENPTVRYKTPNGFMFQMPDGEERFCGLVSETQVRCMNQAEKTWVCEYAEPPVYFTGCKVIKE